MSRRWWSPAGGTLIVTDVDLDDPHFTTRPVALDLPSLTLEHPWFALPAGEAVEEWAVRWAPDGERVTILRRAAGAGGGGQVWLAARDRAARQLTADASADHGPARWSANGRYLAFHRIPLETDGPQPEIVLWDTATGSVLERVLAGRPPAWLP